MWRAVPREGKPDDRQGHYDPGTDVRARRAERAPRTCLIGPCAADHRVRRHGAAGHRHEDRQSQFRFVRPAHRHTGYRHLPGGRFVRAGVVILLGGIDLSLGVVIGVGGMMIAELTRGSNDALLYAIPLTLLCCLGIGLINGIGVAIAKIPPFIVTLASGITFFGVALGFTAGNSQQSVAPAIQQFMSSRWLGVPYPVYFIIVFAVFAWLFQNKSAEGRKLYAIGSSPGAANVLGLPIAALTIAVYAISGLCAGMTGILLAGYSSSATLDMGDALLMPSIAAVVIGGARVTGGSGIYLGTLAGALFLSTLSTVITTLSLSQGFRDLVQGGIIIIALLLQRGRLNLRSR
ncbi:ABC transporter permease [Mesorhizobium sp. B2-1-6]|nr:ABC transporter permease [Mesorhizobium sp. B2-1-6]